jgi:hypothetical protein
VSSSRQPPTLVLIRPKQRGDYLSTTYEGHEPIVHLLGPWSFVRQNTLTTMKLARRGMRGRWLRWAIIEKAEQLGGNTEWRSA